MTTEQLLDRLTDEGVRLHAEDGKLRVESPDELDAEVVAALHANRAGLYELFGLTTPPKRRGTRRVNRRRPPAPVPPAQDDDVTGGEEGDDDDEDEDDDGDDGDGVALEAHAGARLGENPSDDGHRPAAAAPSSGWGFFEPVREVVTWVGTGEWRGARPAGAVTPKTPPARERLGWLDRLLTGVTYRDELEEMR